MLTQCQAVLLTKGCSCVTVRKDRTFQKGFVTPKWFQGMLSQLLEVIKVHCSKLTNTIFGCYWCLINDAFSTDTATLAEQSVWPFPSHLSTKFNALRTIFSTNWQPVTSQVTWQKYREVIVCVLKGQGYLCHNLPSFFRIRTALLHLKH